MKPHGRNLFQGLLLIAALGSLGCARHFLLDPQAAAARNDRDWTILKSPPPSAGGETSPTARK